MSHQRASLQCKPCHRDQVQGCHHHHPPAAPQLQGWAENRGHIMWNYNSPLCLYVYEQCDYVCVFCSNLAIKVCLFFFFFIYRLIAGYGTGVGDHKVAGR